MIGWQVWHLLSRHGQNPHADVMFKGREELRVHLHSSVLLAASMKHQISVVCLHRSSPAASRRETLSKAAWQAIIVSKGADRDDFRIGCRHVVGHIVALISSCHGDDDPCAMADLMLALTQDFSLCFLTLMHVSTASSARLMVFFSSSSPLESQVHLNKERQEKRMRHNDWLCEIDAWAGCCFFSEHK